ncbi:MAG TPA: RluA family pseudouridine synthase [Gammaproteobacteria bacterium]|nr:RluA family pseudouridine synthase [Gammaproteobacteria bacterium]
MRVKLCYHIHMTELSQHSVQLVEIGPRNAEQRLDNYLLSQLKGVPKSHIYKLLRSGQVRVNKGRKKPDYRVRLGDIVRIPPVRMAETDDSKAPQHLVDRVSQSVIFEDNQLLVLNKPAGIAVHSGSNLRFGVIEMLRQARPDDEMLELVHRLDRETSGCLLIAKSRDSLNQLHQHFREENAPMEKIYRTIIQGRWQGAERVIDLPLLKNTLRGGERMVEVNPQGKEARSLFIPLEYRQNISLMEVKLFTGRTHQIRVHAQSVGHVIAGDKKYGDPAFNSLLKQHGFKRMFLHAWKLSFSLGTQNYNICAPLDDEWDTLINHSTIG